MLLPLDVMDDRPYMTNELESCWKQRMCLATRRETARFVTFLFFGFLVTRYEKTHINVFSNLNDSKAKEIYGSFLSDPAEGFDKNMFIALGCVDEIAFEKEEESALKEMAALEGVAVWLRKSTFVLLSVPVDETSRARIRFSYSTSRGGDGKKAARNWFDKFGITSSLVLLVPAVNRNDDDDLGTHMRLIVPTGMRVDHIIYKSNGKNISVDHDKSISVRWNGDVVSIDVSPLPSRPDFDALIYMSPKLAVFTVPAFVACLVSYIIGQFVLRWIVLAEKITQFPGQSVTPMSLLRESMICLVLLWGSVGPFWVWERFPQ